MLHTFRRLRWRMTCSYILVTIPALILIQACVLVLIGGALYLWLNSQILAEDQARALAAVAPQAASHLRNPTPNQNELNRWLQGTMCGSATTATMFTPDTHPPVHLTAVVDRQGRVLATATDATQPGAMLTEQLDAQARQVLHAALSGKTAPEALAIRRADNAVIAAAPITDPEQGVIGAWLVNVGPTRFFSRDESIFVLLLFLAPLSVVVALFAVGLGMLYGHLTSRGLVRRLRSLFRAAHAWSGGNFAVVVQDRSDDELGHLSQRLNLMAEQLQMLVATRQELAALEERNRLARDLHDSVKQQLFAVSMHLASARALLQNQHAADRMLARTETLVQATQHEVMTTIHALRPAALRASGLADALRQHVHEWSQQHTIAVQFTCNDILDVSVITAEVLFRVAQEGLANIVRHSAAASVHMRIDQNSTRVRLVLTDDGRGFDTNTVFRGLGLQSMQERVAAIGGTLTIQSQPDHGTQIHADVPVHPVEYK